MQEAVIGVFNSKADAMKARDALYAAGLKPTNVQEFGSSSTSGAATRTVSTSFRDTFGTDAHPHVQYYDTAVQQGHPVIVVRVDEVGKADRAKEIMEANGAVDIEEKAQGWTGSGASSRTATAMNSRTATTSAGKTGPANATAAANTAGAANTGTTEKIPVIEEELQVGKRKVERGGVRIYTREREIPVEKTVNLREETVIVERHPVDRPANASDMSATKEREFEIRSTTEEPVVAKTARVVEEVEIARTSTQRTEKVRDTVRRTDVEVEKLDKTGRISPSDISRAP